MNVIAKFGKTQNPKIQSKVYIMAIFSGHLLSFPGGKRTVANKTCCIFSTLPGLRKSAYKYFQHYEM